LDVQARHPDGRLAYGVYRLAGDPPPAPQPLPLALEGPLSFLGYGVEAVDARPGDVVTLQTYWRVEENPGRQLSLMAHLVGPDGVPIAVGDGLGVPVDQWLPGDVIVQRHVLAVPEGTAAGRYTLQTGAYWLDSLARWPVVGGDGGDTIAVGALDVLAPTD
jgi:hypothetical protein